MAFYLIVDPEQKTKRKLTKLISEIDSKANIVAFDKMEEWRPDLRKNGGDEKLEIRLDFDVLILNFHELSIPQWAQLLNKISIEMGSLRVYQVILIGYEEPGLNRNQLIRLPIFNFVFKPFDRLILKETLNSALQFKKRFSPIEIKLRTSGASVGLLKNINLHSISELGFVAIGDESIQPGSFSKFFSRVFFQNKSNYVWAQCVRSLKHSTMSHVFINQYHFFGIEAAALMSLRKHIYENKSNLTSSAVWDLSPPKTDVTVSLAIIYNVPSSAVQLQNDLKAHFSNVEIELIESSKGLTTKKRAAYDMIINWSEVSAEALTTELGPNCKKFLIAEPNVLNDERNDFLLSYSDCFLLPIDRSYLYKKLKIHFSALKEIDASQLINISTSESVKSATFIQVKEISELAISFLFETEIPHKTFREFALFKNEESGSIEVQGFCSFVEKSDLIKDCYFHQFLFFGLTDEYLKSIRLWLMQDYIQNK